MRISSLKPVPWLAVNLHHLFSNGAAFNTQSCRSLTSYAISHSWSKAIHLRFWTRYCLACQWVAFTSVAFIFGWTIPLQLCFQSKHSLLLDHSKSSILKLQSVPSGALAVNKQNCVHLVEEHCSRSYFSLFMSMTNHAGLLRSSSTSSSLK